MSPKVTEATIDNFLYSTDKTKLDIPLIHEFLRNAYWSQKLPLTVLEISIENSFCVGVYGDNGQVAFARYITDYCTFAYLADVFVLPEYRGKGISKKLVQFMLDIDFVQGLRRIMLGTA